MPLELIASPAGEMPIAALLLLRLRPDTWTLEVLMKMRLMGYAICRLLADIAVVVWASQLHYLRPARAVWLGLCGVRDYAGVIACGCIAGGAAVASDRILCLHQTGKCAYCFRS